MHASRCMGGLFMGMRMVPAWCLHGACIVPAYAWCLHWHGTGRQGEVHVSSTGTGYPHPAGGPTLAAHQGGGLGWRRGEQ